MISEAANEGQEITRKQVRRLTDEFTAATSPLPEEIRQRTQENLLPPVRWFLCARTGQAAGAAAGGSARCSAMSPNSIASRTSPAQPGDHQGNGVGHCRAGFHQGELDLDRAMQEAQRLDALGLLADVVGQAQALSRRC